MYHDEEADFELGEAIEGAVLVLVFALGALMAISKVLVGLDIEKPPQHGHGDVKPKKEKKK